MQRLVVVAFALLLPLAGCGDESDPSDADAGPDAEPDAEPPPTNPAYLVASRIRTPGGRTFYVSIEPDLEARTLDLSRSLELNGFSRAYAYDGSAFTMDSESLEITRHEVDAALDLQPGASFSMAGLGIRSFRPLFAFLSEERAYYVDLDNDQVVVWNPRAMTLEDTFPLDAVSRAGFESQATSVEVVGDRVFVTLAWTNFTELSVVPSVAVIVIDAAEDRLEGIFEDDRCAAAGGSFVDENGDLYVVGDNDDGRYAVFGATALPPPCLLRVPAGADGFDPDYYLDLRETTGAPELGHLAGLPDRTAVTRVIDESVDVDALGGLLELGGSEIWQWVVLDVDAGTSTELDIPLTALPFPPFVMDGVLYVHREDTEGGISQLYRVEGGAAIESLTVDGEILQLGRIR